MGLFGRSRDAPKREKRNAPSKEMQVVLYNDKIEIHLNYTDGKRPDEENRRAFSFYSLTQRVEIDTHKIGRDPIVTNYKITLFI